MTSPFLSVPDTPVRKAVSSRTHALLTTLWLTIAPMAVSGSVITSFEADEGFILNSRATTPGTPSAQWSFSDDARVSISNAQAYPDGGAWSLALQSPIDGAIYTVNGSREAIPGGFHSVTWSYINPTATFAAGLYTTWTSMRVYNSEGELSGVLPFYTRFGSNAEAAPVLRYYYYHPVLGQLIWADYSDTNGYLNPLDEWNTITLALDPGSNSYSISINGHTPEALSGLALGAWDPGHLNEFRLISPQRGTTYYDRILFTSAVPEPGTALLLTGGALALALAGRRLRKA